MSTKVGERVLPTGRARRPSASEPGTRKNRGTQQQGKATPWLFLAPYLLLFGSFVIIPAVLGVWISLHSWDYTLPNKPFVGLDNYLALFSPGSTVFGPFWGSMRATGIFTVLSVPLLLIVPLAVEYVHWTEKRGEALLAFGAPLEARGLLALDRGARTETIREAVTANMDRLAQDAISREEHRFRVVLDGRVGMGGLYGGWQYLKAALRGEAHEPRHHGQGR